jgi:hypothetical protein
MDRLAKELPGEQTPGGVLLFRETYVGLIFHPL